MKAAQLLTALGLVFGLAASAEAAVSANCTVSAGGVAFGVYNPLSTTADASTGNLIVTCSGSGSGSTNVTVNLTLSTGLSGTYATRTMLSGSNALNYNIYWSTGHTQIMGNGTGGSYGGTAGPFTLTAGGSNSATGTMYGLIPAQQNAAPGTYTDTIVVTVTY